MKNLSDYINESMKIDESVKPNLKELGEQLKKGFKYGYLKQDGVAYGISEENILSIQTTNDITPEDIQKIVDEFKAEGGKFKYKTDAEWKKAGFKDPLKD